LRDVTAEEASKSVNGTGNTSSTSNTGNLGTTIASHADHTQHLHWSLANMNRAMSGGERRGVREVE
jgi:hypothetical protein